MHVSPWDIARWLAVVPPAACLWAAPCQRSPRGTWTATVELLRTSAVCSVTPLHPLDFGQVESPSAPQQRGSITIDPTASALEAGLSTRLTGSHGAPSAGAAMVQGYSVTSIEVSVTEAFMGTTLAGHTRTLTFAGTWAHSEQAQGRFTRIPGASFSAPGALEGGRGRAHHFRFGGTVSGITAAATPEEYAATFTISVICT